MCCVCVLSVRSVSLLNPSHNSLFPFSDLQRHINGESVKKNSKTVPVLAFFLLVSKQLSI